MSYFPSRFHTDFRKELYLPYSKHLKMKRLLTQVVWIESCITLVFAVICVLRISLLKPAKMGVIWQ